MKKKIKSWLHKIFIEKHIVTRKEMVKWGIYINGKLVKETNGFSPLEMLVVVKKKEQKDFFTQNIMQASKLSFLMANYSAWKLKRNALQGQYYEVIASGEVVFITTITGLTKN